MEHNYNDGRAQKHTKHVIKLFSSLSFIIRGMVFVGIIDICKQYCLLKQIATSLQITNDAKNWFITGIVLIYYSTNGSKTTTDIR